MDEAYCVLSLFEVLRRRVITPDARVPCRSMIAQSGSSSSSMEDSVSSSS